jgi:hypothetical protein
MKRMMGLMAALLALPACGGSGSSSPTGASPASPSASSVCSEVSLSGAGNIGILGCSSTTAQIGPIRYVGSSSVIESYDFDITCNTTGKRYRGSVTVATRTAVVNGATCRL